MKEEIKEKVIEKIKKKEEIKEKVKEEIICTYSELLLILHGSELERLLFHREQIQDNYYKDYYLP